MKIKNMFILFAFLIWFRKIEHWIEQVHIYPNPFFFIPRSFVWSANITFRKDFETEINADVIEANVFFGSMREPSVGGGSNQFS